MSEVREDGNSDTLFRCGRRAAGQRQYFKGRKGWKARITEEPVEVLKYLMKEGVLAEPNQ